MNFCDIFGIFPESSIIVDQEYEPMPYSESSSLQSIHSDKFRQLLDKVAISAQAITSLAHVDLDDQPTLSDEFFNFLDDSDSNLDIDEDEEYISNLGKRKMSEDERCVKRTRF